jgi:hypothetical protein
VLEQEVAAAARKAGTPPVGLCLLEANVEVDLLAQRRERIYDCCLAMNDAHRSRLWL